MPLRAYKYRIYPNKEQEQFLAHNFGCVRFVWNQMVSAFNSWSHIGPNPVVNEKRLKDTEEYSFLKDAISYGLQQKRMDFDELRKQFFNKKRAVKLGRPKFKKKNGRQSFRIPAVSMSLYDFSDLELGLKLPKLKSPIKTIIDRPFTGKPKSVTVSKNATNQYFVSILVEEDIQVFQQTYRSVGIDLGLKDLITLSNGQKLANPKLLRKNQAKLAKLQRALARKQKGSKRRELARIKVARLYQKVSNTRNWLYHNISLALVRDFDTICMESLNIKGMLKNRRLSRAISDASLSTLVTMIKYKSLWYGKTFHQIDTWHPSSKLCSECGYKMDDMNLSVREWTCPECQTNHDRDINAAINILNKGLTDLYGLTSDELADYRHQEEISRKSESNYASSMKCLSNKLYVFYRLE